MQQPPNQYPQQQWQQSPYPSQQQWNPQQPQVPPQWNQQQPSYQPQQYTSMMPPPKKKSRKGLFIILGVILGVALVGCIGVAAIVSAGGQAAQKALNQTATQ